MTLNEEIAKARAAEQKLVGKLNQEESWISKHPAWVTFMAVALVLGLIVASMKGCHG